MTVWTLRLGLALVIGFSGTITLIHARPYDNSELRHFLSAEDCAAPCWQGIHPGQTTLNEAANLLEERGWAWDIAFYRGMAMDTGMLVWTWSDQPPPLIDRRRAGNMWIEDNIVRKIEVGSVARFGDVWLAMPAPDGLITAYVATSSGRILSTASYRQDTLLVGAATTCPVRLHEFWAARVSVVVDDGVNPLAGVSASSPYQLPQWMGCQ